MMSWLLMLSALAVEPDRFPWKAEVQLPAAGVHRITIPNDLRSQADPPNGSDMLLVNGEGTEVPIAWLRGPSGEKRWVDPGDGQLQVVPRGPREWSITVLERPIDGLEIALRRWSPVIADVSLTEADGTPVSGPHRIWSVGDRRHLEVPLPPKTGTWVLRTTSPQIFGASVSDIRGVRWEQPPAPTVRFMAPLSLPSLTEFGTATYDLVLPRPLPITGVTVMPTDLVYERVASLSGEGVDNRSKGSYTFSRGEYRSTPTQAIRGIRLADTHVHDAWVPRTGDASDLLTLVVSTNEQAPLEIPEVEVRMDGVVALVQDPGPGPHVLYGGARVGTSPSWDLQIAAADLARVTETDAAVGAVGPNPSYTPFLSQTGVVDPGAEIVLRGYSWRRAIEGATGMVRFDVPADVLVEANRGLSDLRIIDSDGRQVPFVLRARSTPQPWPDLPVERVEDGTVSVLEVPLPVAGAPVAGVVLRTSSTLFEREVSIGRPAGGGTDVLRTVRWKADDRPGQLHVRLGTAVGDRVVVRIDNGDNPPLPITGVDLGWPSWEVVTHVPAGGASLVYGNHRALSPDYDLAMVRDEAFAAARQEATLGPAESYNGPTQTAFDRAAVMGGLGVLGLGLAWLTLQLVRATPEPETSA